MHYGFGTTEHLAFFIFLLKKRINFLEGFGSIIIHEIFYQAHTLECKNKQLNEEYFK